MISQYTATSKRVNQMGHHKKSRRQIMGLWPVLPTDSVKLVFTRIPTFLSKKGIKLFRGIFRCFQIFKTVSKLFGYFQMVSKLSRRFQNCRDLSGWLKNLPDGCTTGRIFSDGHKIIRTVSQLMGYFQMISNFPAIGFKIDRMVPDLFKISFGWRTMITFLRLLGQSRPTAGKA